MKSREITPKGAVLKLGSTPKLEQQWGDKYPIVIRSWRNKWDNLSVYFGYPELY